MERVAYLDHAATTPVRPEAAAAMLPWLTERFGNPSGSHRVARVARQAVDEARDEVAAILGCAPGEVVFTGGGTEADNLAVIGVCAASRGRAVCSAIEHHAVLHPVEAAGGTVVGVGADGIIDLDRLDAALADDVALVSVMLANNEVGVVQPLDAIVETVRRRSPRAVVHTDAVQAMSWLDVAERASGAALVSIAGHKLGGPQGVGALVVRAGTPLAPLVLGGGQERERRSGTHNVAGIVGLAAALRAVASARDEAAARVRALRDRLADRIIAGVSGAVETGGSSAAQRDTRLPNICHLRIPGAESEPMLVLLDESGVCASAGSACASGALEPSHVLAAMGVAAGEARTSLRLSLGWTSTDDDVDAAARAVVDAAGRLRGPVALGA